MVSGFAVKKLSKPTLYCVARTSQVDCKTSQLRVLIPTTRCILSQALQLLNTSPTMRDSTPRRMKLKLLEQISLVTMGVLCLMGLLNKREITQKLRWQYYLEESLKIVYAEFIQYTTCALTTLRRFAHFTVAKLLLTESILKIKFHFPLF